MLLSQKQASSILDEVQQKFDHNLGQIWSVVASKVASLPDGSAALSDKLTIWNGKDTFVVDCNVNSCQLSKLTFEKKEGWGIPFIWGCTSYSPRPNSEEVSIGKFDLPDSMIFNPNKDASETTQTLDQAGSTLQEDTSEPEMSFVADVAPDRDLIAKDGNIVDISTDELETTMFSDALSVDANVNDTDQSVQDVYSSIDSDDIQTTPKPDESNSQDYGEIKDIYQDTQDTFDSDDIGDDQVSFKLDEIVFQDIDEVKGTLSPYCSTLPCVDPNNDGDLSDAIVDLKLRVAIQSALGVVVITTIDANKLTEIMVKNGDVVTLAGLQCFPNLVTVGFYQNKLTDISPLQGLKQLQYLNLSLNKISDVSPLQCLPQLTWLSLQANLLGDISPLQGLAQLKTLYLGYNKGVNISPLKWLTNLVNLDMYSCQIQDISPLQGMTNLGHLDLSNNQIGDIFPLKGKINMGQLILVGNQISDLSPLQGMKALTDLHLDGNQIKDISPLQGLTLLQGLYLASNQISNISALQALTYLQTLSLDANQISDILPLLQNLGLNVGDFVYLGGNPMIPASQIQQLMNKGVTVCTPLTGPQPAGCLW